MNLPHAIFDGRLEKAALKTRALQTLTRHRPALSVSRSVWSASDLSALYARGRSTDGSVSQCVLKKEKKLPLHSELETLTDLTRVTSKVV